MESEKAFDPALHLSKIRGQDYLEVKYRLLWFRREFPHGAIRTTPLKLEPDHAVIQAEVTKIGEGGEVLGVATGIGSETPQGFASYIEKAESKAIGRALAALGFGTQFASEFDEDGAIADAPVPRRPGNVTPIPGSQGSHPATKRSQAATTAAAASDKQLGKIRAIAQERGIADLDQYCIAREGMGFGELTRGAASGIIDALQQLSKDQGNQAASSGHDVGDSQRIRDDTLATWYRNIENARSPGTIAAIEQAIHEAGLADNPELGNAIATRREALGAPAF